MQPTKLLQSRGFWTAALDAVCSIVLLLATRFLSPGDVDLTKQLVVILQPVLIAIIAAYTYADVQSFKAAADVEKARIATVGK